MQKLAGGNDLAKHLGMDRELTEADSVKIQQQRHLEVSSAAVLDCWSEHDWVDSVSLEKLAPFDRIVITTCNHAYEVVVAYPEEGIVLVRGGTYLPNFAVAHLIGSSLGGSTVKLRTVAVGFRIEFSTRERPWLITSPIQSVAVVASGATARQTTTR